MAFSSPPPDKSLFESDFLSWQTKLSNFIKCKDPESYHWFVTTKRYELPRLGGTLEDGTAQIKSRSQMLLKELEDFDKDSRVYKLITMCLPHDVIVHFNKGQNLSSIELWDKLTEVYGLKKSPNVVIKEEVVIKKEKKERLIKEDDVLIKKDEEIKALQVKLLTMENESKELRSKVIGLEKTLQELREKVTNVSQSPKPPVKVQKKILTNKSSEPRTKKVSQFTNYSLQKNKKYSEKSQSTKTTHHQKVDSFDSGHSLRSKRSVETFQKPKRAFKPTQLPESRHTRSFIYTRAQILALAPPRSYHMVQKRRKDFVSFPPKKKRQLALVPQRQFRNETTRFNFRWNSMSLDYIDETYRKFSKISKTIGSVLRWVPKVVV